VTSRYDAHGVRFQFPEEWTLTEQCSEQHIAINVDSPNTSFWSLTLFLDRPQPRDVIQSVIETFREEYDEIDVYPSHSRTVDQEAVARDIEFFCLEMVNGAFVRVFETERFTGLILFQGTETELQETRALLDGISASLRCGPDPKMPFS